MSGGYTLYCFRDHDIVPHSSLFRLVVRKFIFYASLQNHHHLPSRQLKPSLSMSLITSTTTPAIVETMSPFMLPGMASPELQLQIDSGSRVVRFDKECVLIPESLKQKRSMVVTRAYSLPLWKRRGHSESDFEDSAHPSERTPSPEEARVFIKVPIPTLVFLTSMVRGMIMLYLIPDSEDVHLVPLLEEDPSRHLLWFRIDSRHALFTGIFQPLLLYLPEYPARLPDPHCRFISAAKTTSRFLYGNAVKHVNE